MLKKPELLEVDPRLSEIIIEYCESLKATINELNKLNTIERSRVEFLERKLELINTILSGTPYQEIFLVIKNKDKMN